MIEKKDCLSTSSPPLHPLLLSILSSSLPFLLFLLGLLSKVMVITLPAVLLLIDWKQGRALKQALKDKIPYVFLAIIFGIIAIYGKRAVITEASLFEMVLMAARSTMFYLEKLFLPTGFSVLYPYTDPITLASPDFFIPLLLLFSLLAILVFLRNPNVTFGLLFFLITLVPTFTTFAKDGVFYIASDRYAYIPSIGILFLVCSLIEAGRRKFSNSNFQFPFNFQIPIFNVALGVIVLLFAYLAHVQSQVWRDSETLFQRALAVSPNSFRAHNNLGNVYRMQGRYVEAIAEFEEAIAIRPMVRTYSNLGAVYRKMGSIDAALGQYESALELDPESAEAYFGLGIVYAQAGNTEEAFASYDRALELDPAYPDALTNRGALHMSRGEIDRALVDYEAALAVNPYFVHARYNLAVALSKVGEQEKAVQEYRRVTRDQPDFLPARVNLGVLLASLGRVSEARDQFRAILRIDPNNEGARSALQQLQ